MKRKTKLPSHAERVAQLRSQAENLWIDSFLCPHVVAEVLIELAGKVLGTMSADHAGHLSSDEDLKCEPETDRMVAAGGEAPGGVTVYLPKQDEED